ncbi:sodium/glutamate symporter [Shouchella shacheensis]|uniref:sodium/glutamate symporter n=1 Tax=Shouchella shacheensis TaxID=1649580 RepID=UPI00074042F1|nr:sodium/glutamate symporter [Shouchella shacheensis]
MSLEVVGFALIVLSMILVMGKWIRLKVPLFQKLFLPSSLIGGFFALLLGPEVLGRVITAVSGNEVMAFGLFPEDLFEVWSGLPELLINVVFASLFIGFALPNLKEVWRVGGPQVALGYTISWAQYVVGILLAITILTPFFNMNPAVGALIEIGFVGGHGTAAGLSGTFEDLGFAEGYDLAVGLATVGILSGVIIGIILVNWAARKGVSQTLRHPDDISIDQKTGIVQKENRESAGEVTTSPMSIEPLALHVGLVGIAIFIGYFLLEGFVWLEAVTWGAASGVYLFEYVPLFPFAMIGGILLQFILGKMDKRKVVDRATITRIQGLALDLLIVSAMATLALSVIGENIVPFLILSVAGVLLNVFLFLYLAPRMIKRYWFERGMGDFGQSTGVAATGIMLLRVVDPENKSPALTAFGYKQILFEPMVGGGLVTAASVPFIVQFGPVPVLVAASIFMIAFWLLGVLYFGKGKPE